MTVVHFTYKETSRTAQWVDTLWYNMGIDACLSPGVGGGGCVCVCVCVCVSMCVSICGKRGSEKDTPKPCNKGYKQT